MNYKIFDIPKGFHKDKCEAVSRREMEGGDDA